MQLSKLLYNNIFWRGINMASVFVLNILIAQTFGAALYGQLFYLINSLSFVLLVVSFSLDSGLTYYASKGNLNLSGAAMLATIWSVVGAIFSVLCFFSFSKDVTIHQNDYLLYCFMYLAGMLLLTFFTALFSAKFHYKTPNLTIALVNVTLGILLFFTKNNFNQFVAYFFCGILLQGVIICFVYVWLFLKKVKINFLSRQEFFAILNYSLIALVANVLFFLVYRVDYWLVKRFVNDDVQLGNYIQVSKVAQLFFVVPSIIASTVFAITAEGKKVDMQKKIATLSRQIFLLVVAMCIPLVLFGYWIFPLVFGNTFTYMYKPFLYLIPGIIALALQSPFSAYNAGMGFQKINVIATLVALIVIIVGNFMFVPKWGINAAAAVSSVGYCTCSLFLLMAYKNKSQL